LARGWGTYILVSDLRAIMALLFISQITAPKVIKILMSALLEGSKPSASDPGKTVYSFRQKTPMPSYLIAIVGGDIVSK
jgi:aminopeptidase N